MRPTLATILEAINRQESASDATNDTSSWQVIRCGKDFVSANGESFWDCLINLSNNPDGLAELLGVSSDKVRQWPSRIRSAIDELQNQNRMPEDRRTEPHKLLPTGQNGAFMVSK